MPAHPVVTCPRCRKAAEYHATIEMLDPPVGRVDIGYCSLCLTLFEQVRETGTGYESTAWPPVCRSCRQPVSVTALVATAAGQTASFACREHPQERWEWERSADRWTRLR